MEGDAEHTVVEEEEVVRILVEEAVVGSVMVTVGRTVLLCTVLVLLVITMAWEPRQFNTSRRSHGAGEGANQRAGTVLGGHASRLKDRDDGTYGTGG